MTEGYAHWITRPILNDFNSGDWLPYPEGGETEESLLRYLRTIYGDHCGLATVNLDGTLLENSTNDWQFKKELVSTRIIPVKNALFCVGEIRQILPNQFSYSLIVKGHFTRELMEDIFGNEMFTETWQRLYYCRDDTAGWSYLEDMIYFKTASDAVRFKLMT